MTEALEALVIRKAARVPAQPGPAGDGAAAARQFDAALMSAGFKASRDLLEHLSGRSPGVVTDVAVRVLAVVGQLTGDHVQHNTYFRDFPAGVPDTMEFWVRCLREALLDPVAADGVEVISLPGGEQALNLLSLPAYGRYQHTYDEMLAAHEALIPGAGDRITVLHLGAPVADEARALYLAMAGSQIPLSAEDLADLALLARHCLAGPQPETITVRENRAVVNLARLDHQAPLLVDTLTDVLRLACAASGGDVSLRQPARFRSFRRPERRILLAALDAVVSASQAKLGDVGQYREQWKRLGERLHPHEHPQWPRAQDVFAVARGDRSAASFGSRVEAALGGGDMAGAVRLLASAPGLLLRSVDRLARLSGSASDERVIVETVRGVAGQASGRVLLSVREHLQNRLVSTDVGRVFANQHGRAWVAADVRPGLPRELVDQLLAVLDTEVASRLPDPGHLVVDPEILGVALPLSGKAAAPGLGVLPRGSVTTVDGDLLRFFLHWRQRSERTDYDLSALLLDASLGSPLWVSWTSLSTVGGVHSGDIVQAPDGATEFIELNLRVVPRQLIIPQVLVYAGEGFDEAEESFFGFMLLAVGQGGAPFEPRTVRMKSDLRGAGRVALPVVFMRGDDGRWRAKWLHLYLRGYPSFNRVEENRLTTRLLLSSIIGRDYLRVSYLVDLLRAKATAVTMHGGGPLPGGQVTYLGLESPDGLTADSVVYTPKRLAELIPP